MSPGRMRARAARGFTLLEVLVSVSLLALLLTLAYASMRTAVNASRSGEALIDRSEELRTSQSFLRRQLLQALPIAYEIDEETGMHYMLDGSQDLLRFVAAMPGYLSRGGPHVQQLALVPDRGGMRLEFRHSQLNGYEPDEPVGGDSEPVVLIEGISDGLFEYRGREPDGQLGDWTNVWETPNQLPQQIRLRLEFDRDDPRDWPLLEVPVLAGGVATFGPAGGMPPARRGQPGRPPRSSE